MPVRLTFVPHRRLQVGEQGRNWNVGNLAPSYRRSNTTAQDIFSCRYQAQLLHSVMQGLHQHTQKRQFASSIHKAEATQSEVVRLTPSTVTRMHIPVLPTACLSPRDLVRFGPNVRPLLVRLSWGTESREYRGQDIFAINTQYARSYNCTFLSPTLGEVARDCDGLTKVKSYDPRPRVSSIRGL
jgi:hypothetical protein